MWASAFGHLSSLQGQAQSWQFYHAPVSGTNSVLETSFEDMEGSVFVGRRVDVVGSDGEMKLEESSIMLRQVSGTQCTNPTHTAR